MATVRALTPDEREIFKSLIDAALLGIEHNVLREMARRAASWHQAAPELREKVPEELKKKNETADLEALLWGEILEKLRDGRAKFVMWEMPGDPQPIYGFGIMDTNNIPKAGDIIPEPGGVGVLPIATAFTMAGIVISYAFAGAVAVGAWIIADGITSIFRTEAEAKKLSAENAAAYAKIVAEEYRRNPEQGRKYADFAVEAGKAAISAGSNPVGWFSSFTGAAGAVAGGIGMLLLAWVAFNALGSIAAGLPGGRKAKRK